MFRDQPGGNRNQSQEWRNDRGDRPSDTLHRGAEGGIAESARFCGSKERSNELAIDPFLEYVRADGQSDDY